MTAPSMTRAAFLPAGARRQSSAAATKPAKGADCRKIIIEYCHGKRSCARLSTGTRCCPRSCSTQTGRQAVRSLQAVPQAHRQRSPAAEMPAFPLHHAPHDQQWFHRPQELTSTLRGGRPAPRRSLGSMHVIKPYSRPGVGVRLTTAHTSDAARARPRSPRRDASAGGVAAGRCRQLPLGAPDAEPRGGLRQDHRGHRQRVGGVNGPADHREPAGESADPHRQRRQQDLREAARSARRSRRKPYVLLHGTSSNPRLRALAPVHRLLVAVRLGRTAPRSSPAPRRRCSSLGIASVGERCRRRRATRSPSTRRSSRPTLPGKSALIRGAGVTVDPRPPLRRQPAGRPVSRHHEDLTVAGKTTTTRRATVSAYNQPVSDLRAAGQPGLHRLTHPVPTGAPAVR